ncbi:MAG TPA: cytochrome c biogenesis protein CcdA [Verrucomicrobiae bacterium]|nr:cytochrome c biogenesis protein CcdA [Verrucomicrobiae bacterium]
MRKRSNRLLTLLLAMWALLPGIGIAQLSPTPGQEATVSSLLSVDRLAPGSPFRIAVIIDLAEPWHVNANNVSTEGLIPTTLNFPSSASVSIDRITYPLGERMKVGWADEPVALYTGRTIILIEARTKADAKPGPVTLEGSLRYQACNDRLCIAPKTVPVTIKTEIGPPGTKSLPVHPEIFGKAPNAAPLPALVTAGNGANESSIAHLIQQRGWLITILIVFLGGLALNLTPCVYPMIAITVSYFGGQSGQRSTGRAFVSSLIYCLGIILTYSTLGLIAALTGSLFGSALQSPVVLVGIALLLVVLALSMFGAYELQPPQFLMQKATGLSSKAGYVGLFLFGAVIGVIAAPCLAPFVVALLAFVGQSGNPWLGWWMFFALASGLGLPYIVLGTFSGLLTRLPKSGTWMVWVKRVFGVALIAVAAWIVSPLWLEATASTTGGITFQPYSAAAVQQATAEHRPVFIDFSADWCGPCRKMERTSFRDKRVVEEAKQFVTLRADLTQEGTPETEKLRKEFGIWGVPTLAFIGPDGREHTELRKVEYVAAPELLDLLEKAKGIAPTNTAAASMPNVPPQLLNPF